MQQQRVELHHLPSVTRRGLHETDSRPCEPPLQFTELNVITTLEALESGGSMSSEELVRSRPFQTLVGEQLGGWRLRLHMVWLRV